MKSKKQVFVGIDCHEKALVVKMAEGKEMPIILRIPHTEEGKKQLRSAVKTKYGVRGEIYAAYEAGPSGPRLAREIQSWGWTCYILSPDELKTSRKSRQRKNDAEDAERILNALRNHILAGTRLPVCWIPDEETFADRELIRYRISIGEKIGTVKNEIHGLLKRNGIKKPKEMGDNWTLEHREWLAELASGNRLPAPTTLCLAAMLRQLAFLEEEERVLNEKIEALSQTPRYRKPCQALMKEHGVGLLVAMTFLLELGDMKRFQRGSQIGAYVGLVPRQYESGETRDRKGRITKAGSWRLRKILNQAAWTLTRCYRDDPLAIWYRELAKRRGKKKAIVGVMRRLAIRLWDVARKAA